MSSETGYVELTLQYEPDIAGGPAREFATEHYPLRVDYFGTNQLAHCGCPVSPERQTRVFRTSADTRQFFVRIHKHTTSAENGIGAQQPFFEAGAYKPVNAPLALKSGLAASTSIVLMFYATTYTTLQQSCWTNVGMAVLPIAALHGGNGGKGKRFDIVQYRDPDSEASTPHFSPPRKGTLLVVGFNAGGLNVTPQPAVKYDTVDDRVLRGIIDRNLGQFFPDHHSQRRTSPLSHPTEPYLGPFHVPVNQQRRRLASCTYAMLRAHGPISVPYYERLLAIALRRSDADVETAMKWSAFIDDDDTPLDAYSTPEQNAFVSVAVRLIVVFPLSQRYLDDTLNRNVQSRPYSAKNVQPDEDFKICRLCGGDDCEGVCLEAMIHARDLIDADERTRAQMSPLLRRVCDVLRLFVPMMMLGCVTNKKATTATLDESNALAHTFCALVPFWQFYNDLDAKNRDWVLQTQYYARHRALLDRFRGDGKRNFFTTTMAEATAPIDPAMRPVFNYYKKRTRGYTGPAVPVQAARDRRELCARMIAILDEYNLAEVLQPEMLGPPDDAGSGNATPDYSPFYKFVMSASTPTFADTRVFDYAFALSDKMTYGVPYDQVIDEEDSSAPPRAPRHGKPLVVPYLKLTEDEMRNSDAALMEMPPIPALQLPPDDWRDDARIAQWEPHLRALKRWRATPANEKQALHPRLQYLTIYIDDLNANVLEALRRIAALPSVAGVAYEWFGVNAAVDGTNNHNIILDIYLKIA